MRYWNRQLVDAETGELTALVGEPLEAAKKANTVITKGVYDKRKYLVDAETGKPTSFIGEALETAKKAKTVITRNAYYHRKSNRQLVDIFIKALGRD